MTLLSKVALISLGCAKNLVDSELILGRLASGGHEITSDPAEAEVIIVNTCGFIGPAKEEAVESLLEAAKWKKKGRCRLLVGAGCLVQRYGMELVRAMPEVDLWLTRARYGEISSLLERAAEKSGLFFSGPPEGLHEGDWPRLRSTPPHRAYLRIADGCDNRCRYCVIPAVRGPYRSRPPEEIVAEAGRLAAEGVREITLIAQDTTAYGRDLPGRPRLSALLRRLVRIDGPRWWRILYAHPARIDEELIEVLAQEPKVCRYLDLPIQHISPRILGRMGRPPDAGAIRRLIARLRAEVPGIALRTTLMVGFPGETGDDFRLLRDFVADTRFDWLGVFAYSREEGTPATRLPGQVPARVKEDRRAEILRLQQGISRELLAARVGGIFPVLVEGPHPERPGWLLARSEREAPEVDGVIHLRSGRHQAGDFVKVRAVKAGVYDLEAEPADEEGPGRSLTGGVEA